MDQYLTKSIKYLFDNYIKAKSEIFANNPMGYYIRKIVPQNFYNTGLIDNKKYIVDGSVGQGNWAQVPWICIFNQEITKSATKGVYIVYLLSADGKSLYLTLNQGCTEIRANYNKKQTIEIMRDNAQKIINLINNNHFSTDEEINLGNNLTELAELYQKGAIFYKKYIKQDIPTEEQLRTDLKNMLDIYDDYYNKIFNNSEQSISLQENNMLRIKTSLIPLILYGAPGTGKTYKMQYDYIAKYEKENCFVTTFHQSFSYEEFVEGLKPDLENETSDIKYQIKKGIFYQACEQAAKIAGFSSLDDCIKAENRKQKMKDAIENKKLVLLCIDEINRANVSAVFGDLISLIEPSKRIGADNEMIVKLPYSKNDFGVPANLMIVGTMNTADRSIQLLDSALRRRFRFEELQPDYKQIKNKTAREILQQINARIRCLLDKDHQIGHSYFIDSETDLDIFNTLKDYVIPLLEEYFYNDAQKIRQILNEKDDSDLNFYVNDKDAQYALSKLSSDFINDEKEIYMLNPALSYISNDTEAHSFIEHIWDLKE